MKSVGRFAVGGSAGFALGPFIAGGVYVFGGQFLWVFTLIALLGVLLYLYAFMGEGEATDDTDIADVADAGNRESRAKVLSTGTNDSVSYFL
jgi:FSR family fosmidomycin resistance protein-like MFS transporter